MDSKTMSEENKYCAYTSYDMGNSLGNNPAVYGENISSSVEQKIWDALYTIDDPEMPLSIVDLGLIYGVNVSKNKEMYSVSINMTITYTGCPARDYLVQTVEQKISSIDEVSSVHVSLVMSPEWSIEMITDTGKEKLKEWGVSL